MNFEQAHEVFRYEDGKLYWRISPTNTVKVGDRAGTVTFEGYRQVGVDGQVYREHRVIFLMHHGYMPEYDCDHINRDRADNRIENLREVSRSCNMRNASISSRNTSGVTGVSWDKSNEKWLAQIRAEGRSIKIGRFEDFKDAVSARYEAEIKYGWDHCNNETPAAKYMRKQYA